MVQVQVGGVVLLCGHRGLQEFLVSGKHHRHKTPNKPMKKPHNTCWRYYQNARLLRICGSCHHIFLSQHKSGISASGSDSFHVYVWTNWWHSLFSSWDQSWPNSVRTSLFLGDPGTGSSLSWFGCPHHLAMDYQVLPAPPLRCWNNELWTRLNLVQFLSCTWTCNHSSAEEHRNYPGVSER